MTTSILNQLQSLYSESETTKEFFEILARRTNDAKETRVTRTLKLMETNKVVTTKREILRIMHRLEELGLGRYVPGRHASPSRFEWSTSAKAVANAATGQTEDLDLNIPPGSETSSEEDSEIAMLEHRFYLRPELPVVFELPVDMTTLEAERLAAFVRTLPMFAEEPMKQTNTQP